jgi:hypothetical protein
VNPVLLVGACDSLWWEEGYAEAWYLATDLDDPREAIRLYEGPGSMRCSGT